MNPILNNLKDVYLKPSLINFFLDDDKHKNYFNVGYLTKQLLFLDTPKVFFIYSYKSASTFIEKTIINPSINNKIDLSIKVPINGVDLIFKEHSMQIDIESIQNDNSKDVFNELIKILNGKSKKDLLIITRNSVTKFISGIIMEIESFVNQEENISFEEASDDTLYNCLLTVLNDNYKINHRYSARHSTLLNKFFYLFLTYNKNIDNSKLKIIDLDNKKTNLNSIILKYYPELKNYIPTNYWTQSDRYDKLFTPFVRVTNDVTIRTEIKKELYEDILFYNSINEIYKNNLIYE